MSVKPPAATQAPAPLLTAAQVAVMLGVSGRTVEDWRATKRGGPAWIKIGKLVRYRLNAVENYLERNTHTPTAK